MRLRQRILGSPETISDLVWAAEQRYQESGLLFDAGRFSGCVYLAGLSCEMWLKNACFRSLGSNPSTPVASQLGPARDWMQKNMPTIQHESYHSILFWAEYLIRRREQIGNALSREFVGQLRHHMVNRVFSDWKLEIRYRAIMPSRAEALRVGRDAGWLRIAQDSLWR